MGYGQAETGKQGTLLRFFACAAALLVVVAGLVAGKIITALARPFEINGHVCKVSGSIGIACYPDDGESGDQLVNRADEAMYLAKRGGRNQYRFHSG